MAATPCTKFARAMLNGSIQLPLLWAVGYWALSGATACATDSPPWHSLISDNVPTTRHDVLASTVTIGRVATIVFDKTRLTDLYASRTIPEIHHVGDAGDSVAWGCMSVATPDGPVIVRPTSGEMGGDNRVTGVQIQVAPKDWPARGTRECPMRTGLDEQLSIKLDTGITFGASQMSVTKALGRPSSNKDAVIDYRFSAPVPNCPKCEGIVGDVAFRFEGPAMSVMEVSRVSASG